MARRRGEGQEETVERAARASLVGRDTELAALRDELASGTRLVTLVGPPGTGKTRLALAWLDASGQTSRRAFFVDLSAVTSRAEVLAAVSRALPPRARRVTVADSNKAADLLLEALRGLRSLEVLVLDNAEQVVEDVAWWVERLLAHTSLSLVVTSREALRVTGERVHRVAPLELPDATAEPEAILRSEAVRLLVERASGYVPTSADAPGLARLARLLDGIPLAIELVAGRLAVLGVDELVTRLGGASAAGPLSLDLVAHGRRDASERQATLRGALDASYALLEPDEAAFFGALSLFRGTFAASDALAMRPAGVDDERAIELLQSLVDRSLVVPVDPRGRESTTRSGRLRLLETVRAYASEKPRELDATQRLASHLARRTREALAALDSRRAVDALAWLAAELDNLLAIFDACHARKDADAADLASLLLGVDAIVRRVGPAGLHASRLDSLLARPRLETVELDLRMARARIHRDVGAMDACERELALAVERANERVRSVARAELGEALLARGSLELAESTLRTAVDEAEAASCRRGEQSAVAKLGLLLHARGRLDEALELYERALDLAARLASPSLEAAAHRDLGNVLLQCGAFERARAHYAEALARAPHDDLRLEAIVRGNLGILDLEEGALDGAVRAWERALACLRRVGDRTYEAHLLVYAGLTEFERGEPVSAASHYDRAIDTLAEVGDVRMEGVARAARAVARAASGEHGAAANDLAVARRRFAVVADPSLDALYEIASAHAALLAGREADARARAERVVVETSEHATRSDDVRFALRALRRALPAERFAFAVDGTSFVAPDGQRIDLARRATLARLLARLVDRRVGAPGAACSFDELVAAGWPGERVLPLAAQNRLRVAVTTLRNMGLRHVLVFRDGGHLLDPEVPVELIGAN